MVEDVLGNLSLLRRRRPAEVIEVAVEPLVDLGVECVVLVANLLGCHTFLTSFRLSRSSILVCAANVDSVVASETAVPGVDISR